MLEVDLGVEETIIDIDTVGYGSNVAKKILTQLKDHVDTKVFNKILSNLDEVNYPSLKGGACKSFRLTRLSLKGEYKF